jgi:hypothetical protein
MFYQSIAKYLSKRKSFKKKYLRRLIIKKIKFVKKRAKYKRADFKESCWYRLYLDQDHISYRDPTSKEGKLFRRRFRVPYPIFSRIVEILNDSNKFKNIDKCFDGTDTIPIALLVLATLRLLGRGITFDGVAECTNISEETIRVFFHKVCSFFSNDVFDQYVCSPTSEEEISQITSLFSKLGKRLYIF